jgi:hypothetical protein
VEAVKALFHARVLRRELPAERTAESGELLQGSGGAGESREASTRLIPEGDEQRCALMRENGQSGDIGVATAPPETGSTGGHANNPGKANIPTRAHLSQI